VADAGPIYTSSTEVVSLEEPLKVSMLAAEAGRPGMPAIITGRDFRGGEARETVIDRNVALRSGIKVGDEIQIRSTQGVEDQFFTLNVVGMVDGQSYFFQPTIFVPPATWEKYRPQSEADLNSDTAYPNIIAVKVTDQSQIDTVKERLLANVPNIEVTDITTTINNIPGSSAQQGINKTQGSLRLDRCAVIGGFPDPDPAEGSADRCFESHWLLKWSGWLGGCDPDHHSNRNGCRDRRRADLSLLARFPSYHPAGLQWNAFAHRHCLAAVHWSIGRYGFHYLCSTY
jgi:hypothetical protein